MIGYELTVIGYELTVIGYELTVIGYELTVIGYELTGFHLTPTSFDILVGGYERILNDLPSARIKRMARDQKVLCGNYSRKFCKVIIVTLPTLSLLHLRHTAVNA